MHIFYHVINMGLLFPYIPKKKVQPSYVWRHNDFVIVDFAKLRIFSKTKFSQVHFFLKSNTSDWQLNIIFL